MRCSRANWPTAAAMALGLALAVPALAEPLAVEVTNASEPVLCAEKDNVTLAFTSTQAKRFRIEAAHPAYIGALNRDSFEADWTQCDMSGDPVHASAVKAPTRRTLYEEPALWVVGWTMPLMFRSLYVKLARVLDLGPEDDVLDVACG